MRNLVLAALPALMLAGCGGETTPAANETAAAAVPAAFPVGEWEVNSTVERIASTDGSTPAVSATQGDKATRKACVADADELSKLFADEGADCKVTTTCAPGPDQHRLPVQALGRPHHADGQRPLHRRYARRDGRHRQHAQRHGRLHDEHEGHRQALAIARRAERRQRPADRQPAADQDAFPAKARAATERQPARPRGDDRFRALASHRPRPFSMSATPDGWPAS